MKMPAHEDDGIKISIKPTTSTISSTDEAYTGTLNVQTAPRGGFFLLSATIPAGYEFIMPPSGSLVGTYTMINQTTGLPKIIIVITSNNQKTEIVDVRYSTDGGANFKTKKGLSLKKTMVIGSTSLKLTKPTSYKDGHLELSLGGTAGPVNKNNKVIVEMAKGTLKNPGTKGTYIWYLVAKNNPEGTAYTASAAVFIK